MRDPFRVVPGAGGSARRELPLRSRSLADLLFVGLVLLVTSVGAAGAQETEAPPAPEVAPATEPAPAPATAPAAEAEETEEAEEEERPTGLPKWATWTFNLDAGFGIFGFSNSLYTNVRPDPSGELSDDWAEGFVKPAISMSVATGESELFGKLSAVGERTFEAPPSLVGEDASSYQVEDLYLGWRSGTSLGNSENLLELTGGRAQYKIGHGLILWDGGGEGGSRGGFWSGARKAWEVAGIVRLKPKNHTFEAFFLDRDEVPESDTDTELWGVNYELALGEATTLGASYLDLSADPLVRPLRDGLEVFDVRAFTAPFKGAPGLSFELEYAAQENGDLLDSEAWNALVAYEFGAAAWTPKISYRYAFFEGDDPATAINEGFDSLFPGFYDWGTWWQGEIAGEYFLANSNLISHQARVHVAPTDSIGTGLIGYLFSLDEPAALGPAVTSEDVMVEVDGYCDWSVNSNLIISFVAAYGNPRLAVEQAFDRTDDFQYGMIYFTYSY